MATVRATAKAPKKPAVKPPVPRTAADRVRSNTALRELPAEKHLPQATLLEMIAVTAGKRSTKTVASAGKTDMKIVAEVKPGKGVRSAISSSAAGLWWVLY